MLTGRGNTAAYDFVSLRVADEGSPLPHVRVHCAKCDNTLLGKIAATSNRPEAIAKWARGKSWIIEPLTPSSVRCPDCQKAARDRARGDRPEKEKATMTDAASNVAPLPPPTRKLTAVEKMKVRQLLDHQFDEQKGIYLESYSDQRVGAEAGVPWANVRELREAAYGPLRSVPELEALQADHAKLLGRYDELEKATAEVEGAARGLRKDVATLQAEGKEIANRIASLSTRLGVAA